MATLQFTRSGDLSASMEWLRLGDFVVNMGLFLDNTAATMLMMVSFVGLLIHVFSVGYMRGDVATLAFLVACQFSCFRCWESCSQTTWSCSSCLGSWPVLVHTWIGHYIGKDEAAQALKAFIVNRVRLGFVGIVFAYWHFGTTQLTEPPQPSSSIQHINGTIAAL